MENFTPVSALVGGALIGAAAVLVMWSSGRIAGISGIFGGLLPPVAGDWPWRLAFVAGMVAAPLLVALIGGRMPETITPSSLPLMIAGGFLVGLGTRLGSGCTSGHGVCGVSRLSPRSLAATGVFMFLGFATVFVVRHAFGG